MTQQNSSWINLPQRSRDPVLAFQEALRQFGCIFCAVRVGIVKSFNPTAQTVTVQLAINENIKVNTPDGQGNIVPVPTPTTIDLLTDVPVLMYGGGGFSVCPPITAGDECIVLFSDNCINSWWANGGVQNQEVSRRHNLSDGIAIVGLRSQPHKITNYNSSALEIRSDDDNTKISVSPGSVVVTPDGGTTEITLVAGVATVKAASIVFDGPVTFDDDVTFDNDVTVTGDVSAADFKVGTITLATHQHGGVQNGSGVTGGPFG